MPVSGLVILLDSDEARAASALCALRDWPEIEIGQRVGPRLATVAVTPSPAADRDLIDAIQAVPGVRKVDIVFVEVEATPRDQRPHSARTQRENRP